MISSFPVREPSLAGVGHQPRLSCYLVGASVFDIDPAALKGRGSPRVFSGLVKLLWVKGIGILWELTLGARSQATSLAP